MPTEKPRYTVIVDDELLKRIDDFRFENRYPSRSAATLELIRVGMEALEKKQAKAKKAQKKPTPCIEDGLDIREEYFMELVQRLEPGRQRALLEQALSMIERQKTPSPVSDPATGNDKPPTFESPTRS